MKPFAIIFSSSSAYPVAEAVHAHLKETHNVHLWKDDFFGENKTTPLWTFFKKLFHYDYAILVLSNDSMIREADERGTLTWIPKDNVIFELGATMARLGPQKTIMLVPETPPIHLPGYFDDVQPHLFRYRNDPDHFGDATKDTASAIARLLDDISFENFHSELPAQGLAHAYLNNFLFLLKKADLPQDVLINGRSFPWKPSSGVRFTILMPSRIMGGRDANRFFEEQAGCFKTSFRVSNGRDIGIYVLPREHESDPLHILDIPTTLLTAENIIERIELFWREKDSEKVQETDIPFMEALKAREIINFRRTLENQLMEVGMEADIISTSEVEDFISRRKK